MVRGRLADEEASDESAVRMEDEAAKCSEGAECSAGEWGGKDNEGGAWRGKSKE